MSANQDLAYDLRIAVCGETFAVRRTLDLALRMEQAFGAIIPLSRRLRACDLRLDDLAHVIDILLRDDPDAADIGRRDISLWLYANGLPKTSLLLAAELLTLIAGNEAVGEYQARQQADPASLQEGRGPFVPTAA